MKRFLTLLLGLVTWATSATHIIGGEIRYTYLGNGLYDLEMLVYRDPNGGPLFDDPAIFSIRDEFGAEVLTLDFFLDSMDFVPLSEDTCYASGSGLEVVVERGYYRDTVSLPDSTKGYVLIYQRCCRNATILNIPNPLTWGATYATRIPARDEHINSNPHFPSPPPIVVCVNQAFYYDHSGVDADGDSLSYAFGQPFTGGSQANPAPVPPPPPFTPIPWAPGYSTNNWIDANPNFAINPITGVITGTPTTIGQYVTQVRVTEWRNGENINVTWRDFQVNVVQCLPYPTAVILEQNDSCSGLNGTYIAAGNYFDEINWTLTLPDGTQEPLGSDSILTLSRPDTGAYILTLQVSNGICGDTVESELWLYEPDIGLGILGPDSVCFPQDQPEWNIVPNVPAEGSSAWYVNGVEQSGSVPEPSAFSAGYNQISFTKNYRGCSWSDTADVYWAICVDIKSPNVFTPNGDGENDNWYPFWEYEPERIEIVIFDRWGVKVFEGASDTPDLWKGWNGVNYSSKQDCSEGTYYWVVRGFALGEIFSETTGFLTLLR